MQGTDIKLFPQGYSELLCWNNFDKFEQEKAELSKVRILPFWVTWWYETWILTCICLLLQVYDLNLLERNLEYILWNFWPFKVSKTWGCQWDLQINLILPLVEMDPTTQRIMGCVAPTLTHDLIYLCSNSWAESSDEFKACPREDWNLWISDDKPDPMTLKSWTLVYMPVLSV